MDKLDNGILIKAIFKRKPLWDNKHEDHHRRDAIKELWDEVASLCNSSCDNVKRRWKNLRDTYRVELKKAFKEAARNGRRIASPKWMHFKEMDFLRFIFVRPEDLDKLPPYSFGGLSDDDSLQSDPLAMVTSSASPSSIALASALMLNKMKARQSHKRKSPYEPKKVVSETELPASDKVEVEDLNEVAAKTAKVRQDGDYHFLMSLHSHLSSLSPANNLKFRCEVYRMLSELKESEETGSTYEIGTLVQVEGDSYEVK